MVQAQVLRDRNVSASAIRCLRPRLDTVVQVPGMGPKFVEPRSRAWGPIGVADTLVQDSSDRDSQVSCYELDGQIHPMVDET